METVEVEVEVDIDEFETDELIEELMYRINSKRKRDYKELKALKSSLLEIIFDGISLNNFNFDDISMVDLIKLELFLNNINKISIDKLDELIGTNI